jgi:hypothetical protein
MSLVEVSFIPLQKCFVDVFSIQQYLTNYIAVSISHHIVIWISLWNIKSLQSTTLARFENIFDAKV